MDDQPQKPPAKKSGPAIKYAVVPAVLFVVLGAGAAFGALYTQTWSPSWNPFRPDPAEVLADTARNMEEAKLTEFDADVSYSMLNIRGEETVGFQMDLTGTEDKRDAANAKFRSGFDAEINYGGIRMAIAGDAIYIEDGQYIYLKLDEMPFLPFFETDEEAILGRWISFEATGYDVEEEKDVLDILENIVQDPESYSLEILPDEKINGADSYHYSFALPVNDLYPEGAMLFGEEAEMPVDVWISKKDLLVNKASISFTPESDASAGTGDLPGIFSYLGAAFEYSTTSEPQEMDWNSDPELDYNSEFMQDFNMDFTMDASVELSYPETLSEEITAPAQTVSIEDLFQF